MEKIYTRQQLEKRTVNDLREILVDRDLPISGRKDELIDRILAFQNEKKEIIEQSYFNLLPSDIRNIAEEYRLANEPNNKVFVTILKKLEELSIGEFRKVEEVVDVFNEFFRDYNLPIKLIYTQMSAVIPPAFREESETTPWTFKIGKLPFITDEILIDFLYLIIITKRMESSFINSLLYKYNINIRISIFYLDEEDNKEIHYEINKVKVLKHN